jgi:hypothetical protein
MRIKATIVRHTGRVRHGIGAIVDGEPRMVQPLPLASKVEIVKEAGGFLLLRLDQHRECISDTWHESLEAAKRQALFEFGIDPNDWAAD